MLRSNHNTKTVQLSIQNQQRGLAVSRNEKNGSGGVHTKERTKNATPETHKPQQMRSQKNKKIQLCAKVGKKLPTVFKRRSLLYHTHAPMTKRVKIAYYMKILIPREF